VSQIYDFTFLLSGVDELTGEVADVLYEAGCDDASPQSTGSKVYVTFHREASSLEGAIKSAVTDVRKAGLEVSQVEIEDFENL
jgi:hypothetical protein